MTNLEYLGLAETSVSDEGLIALSALTTLRSLDLRWTGVTGRGFEWMSRMTGLEDLYLSNVPIEQGDVKFLAGLSALRVLDFGATALTDGDLAHLADSNIESLTVMSDLLGDEACGYIVEIASLEMIHLRFAHASSAGIEKVLQLPNLKFAVIRAPSISEDERERLCKGKPGQTITIVP